MPALSKMVTSKCPSGTPHHWLVEEAGPSAILRDGFNAKCKKCGATSGPERNQSVADKNKVGSAHPYLLHDYSKAPAPASSRKLTRKCDNCKGEFIRTSPTQKWCPECKPKILSVRRKCFDCGRWFEARRIGNYRPGATCEMKFENRCDNGCKEKWLAEQRKKKARPPITKTCAYVKCGKEFQTQFPRKRFHTTKCKDLDYWHSKGKYRDG